MTQLGVSVVITAPEIDASLEDFNALRLYRAMSQGGTYILRTTITLVADTTAYPFQDTTGTLTDWGRFSFFHTGTLNESALSEPFPYAGQPVYTRRTLRQLIADELGLYGKPNTERAFPGPSGITTAGTTAAIVLATEYLDTTFVNESFAGYYLLIATGAAIDQVRRVALFTAANGGFDPQPDFSVSPSTGASFELYGEERPGWFDDRLNEAIKDVPIQLRYPLAGIANQREYALPDFIFASYQIFGIEAQNDQAIREHTFRPGVHFDVIEREGGGLSLYFHRGLPANRVYYVTGRRYPTELLDDDDTILLDDQRLRLLVTTAAQKAATRLLLSYGGSDDHSRWKALADLLERRRRGLVKELRPWPKAANPRRGTWLTVAGERRRAYPLGY